MSLTSNVPAGERERAHPSTSRLDCASVTRVSSLSCLSAVPVSAAGLVTVLYWFCVEMMLDLGLRAGEDSRDSSSIMLQLRG